MTKKKKRTKWIIVGSIIVLLVAFRIALPFLVTNYVNKVLSEIDGYTGSIDDVDIALYRGAYQIHKLKLDKVESDIPQPFVKIETIDLSLQWTALFKGEIVGEIEFINPVLNFVAAPPGGEAQTGEENDWVTTVKDLMPLQINKMQVFNGRVAYLDNHVSPKVDVYLNELDLLATNLTNADDKGKPLPSNIKLVGSSLGNGILKAEMNMNPLKEIPDFDLNLKFEGCDMTALNDFLDAYAKFDVNKGTFNMYSEIALKDGNLTGYVKPVIDDMDVYSQEQEKADGDGLFRRVWEGIVGGGKSLLENQKKGQVANRVPVEGTIDNTTPDIWTAIFTLIKNAYINPFAKEIDKTIDFNSVDSGATNNKK